MEEVRQLVQEEGREARNLVAFHVAVDNPVGRLPRKPPRAGLPPPRRAVPRTPARLRSASAGRDKRSELRARYWALLFGDLQRAVGELYNTVEAHESPNECQEVILVLENYTRDFKALCEWFRLKWEYESTPPPQRPQSLAWEIRKTDFVRPESRRTHSVKSSPSVSGKNSPCLSGHNTPSGKNSPNLTGKASPGSGKISPRLSGHVTSPKGSIEFFSSKVTSKIATKPEPKIGKETRLSDIKEKDVKEVMEEATKIDPKVAAKETKSADAAEEKKSNPIVEVGKAKECLNVVPMQVIVKSPNRTNGSKLMNGEVSSQAKATIDKLDAMETMFLATNSIESTAKNDNLLNQGLEHDKNYETHEGAIEVSTEETVDRHTVSAESPSKSEDNFADISNESLKCDDNNVMKVPEINKHEIIVREATKAKNTDVTAKAIATTDVNGYESLKYKDSMIKITNDSIENAKLEEIPKKDAEKDIKPKKDLKNEIKEKSKTELNELNGKGPKTQRFRKFPKGLKKLENQFIFKKEDTRVIETLKRETEHMKKEELKKLETKPIFQLKSSSRHVYTTLTIEDIDIKKNEIKNLETKPIFEVKAPTRPAFNQATIDLDKKEDIKKVDTKPISDLKPAARPAYSQAAAKPKLVTTKAEIKTQTKALARSKTVVEIRPSTSRTAIRNPKSKCSYPFNLTTGRSSLFDGGANKASNKKPVAKPLSTGDRSQSKTDTKRPPRPLSLKLNEKGDKEEKNNLTDINKDLDEYSSSETIVTQIDISRIESTESLKTIVPDNEYDVANSIEVLNIDGTKNDNEGWLTVKSRRLSRESKKYKSHWANRFNQPSATTSLPTLNMIESPKSETNPITTSQLDRAKSEQPQTDPKADKKQVTQKTKDTSMIRQKSDVTGLKTKSSRNKAIRKDKKIKDSDEKLTKNRLHSSLESLTNGLARSQESTADAFDFDKWRAEFKSTFKYLEEDDQNQDDTEILKTADPSEMSEIAEMTSQIEENERKISLALDFQTEVDQRKLCEEEDLLNRQIMELQEVSDIDLDTETDDTETDAEILCEDSALESCQSSDTLSSLSSRLEDQYEGALAGMSWAERVDTLGVLEELVARDPGRAQQLHAKLSQGIKRRGSLQDALRRLQAKQARAERQRTHFHTERAKKIHQLLARVEEVKVAKNQLIDEKRIRMERRLQKAAENRNQHIKDIVRKAHDEEEKLREIAFIKQLEAENRRHEFLEQCRSHTTRLREMRRERLDKLEQKTAREAAVGARKKALDEARKLHVEGLLEKRKQRDARVEGRKERRKQERDDAAREKAEGLKSRLSAIAAAAELEADALRSRIRDKQDASQQRLESHLQAIREKATTGPRQATISESQEAEKKEEAAKLEREKKEKEKQKNIRKKARKFKQKLLLGTKPVSEMLDTLPMSSRSIKLHKLTSQLNSLVKSFTGGDGPCAELKKEDTENNNIEEKKPTKKKNKKKARVRQSSACESVGSSVPDTSKAAPAAATFDIVALERVLSEIHRVVYSKDNQRTIMRADKTLFTRVFTVKTCGQILACAAERDVASQLSTKALNTCVRIIFTIASLCPTVGTIWLLYIPALVHCVTLLSKQIMEKDMLNDPQEDELTRNLAFGISLALNVVQETRITKGNCEELEKRTRVHNLVSYICLSGIVSHPERCGESRKTLQTLLNVIGDILLPVCDDVGPERVQAQQNLRSALNRDIFHMRNELCLLFAEGAELAQNDVFVNAARIVHALRALGEVDYRIVQEGFGEDGWPLEFRAAISRLLNQHAPSDKEAPRKEPLRPGVIRLDAKVSNTFVMDLIELIGYVTVNNAPLRNTICDNWSVIKTLCNLPANWLVSRPHMHKLIPTLLVLSQHLPTMEIVVGEISLQTLAEYLENDAAQQIKLIQLFRQELRSNIKKEAKAKAKANAQTDAKAAIETEAEMDADAKIEPEAGIETEADIGAEDVIVTVADIGAEAVIETEADIGAEAIETEADIGPEAIKTEADIGAEAGIETEADIGPEAIKTEADIGAETAKMTVDQTD